MSDAWKIVQGLKRETQNNSFGRHGYRDTGDYHNYKPKDISELTEEELRDKMWSELTSDLIFDKDDENRNIAHIKSFLQECQNKGQLPDKVKIGEILISINPKNPNTITFSSTGNIHRGSTMDNHQKYPYTITINGDDMYSEVDLIDNSNGYVFDVVYKDENATYVPIRVSQKVSIINGEEISESFGITSEEKDADLQHITEAIAQNNPKYEIGNGTEIYRENIDLAEQIVRFPSEKELISVNADIQTELATIYETYKDYHKNHRYHSEKPTLNSYGEGISIAKEIEEHCQYIYSLFVKAYEQMDKKVETTEIHKDDLSDVTEIAEEAIQNREDSIYNGVNVEDLDDAQLEKFIEEMNNKQKENERKIERLKKLKKAKDLIALNKKQDRIISELESQIQIEGVDFGEQ